MKLSTDTFKRPDDLRDAEDPNVLYARSYLVIRLVVGGIGVLLPTLLFLLDSVFIKGPASVRGSLSAYYHTPARDLFVGALCVIGFFLITYMAGQKYTWDYWLSTIAGAAVLGVAFLPTQRPNLPDGARLCGSGPNLLPGCTQLQHALGETQVAAAHYAFAAFFILSLAMLCFVFGRRDRKHTGTEGRARFHNACGFTILAAVGWIAIGEGLDLSILGIHPLYIGEVVSVYAFGTSWLVKAKDLFNPILDKIGS